jgi:hypothetical protein
VHFLHGFRLIFPFWTTPKFRGVSSPRPVQFYSNNAACTRMGGVPVTSTLVPLFSLSWFYLVGVFATRTSYHDVQKSYYQKDERRLRNILTLRVCPNNPREGNNGKSCLKAHDSNLGLSDSFFCKYGLFGRYTHGETHD